MLLSSSDSARRLSSQQLPDVLMFEIAQRFLHDDSALSLGVCCHNLHRLLAERYEIKEQVKWMWYVPPVEDENRSASVAVVSGPRRNESWKFAACVDTTGSLVEKSSHSAWRIGRPSALDLVLVSSLTQDADRTRGQCACPLARLFRLVKVVLIRR